jgi:prepilin-type N-terminal cleavage/methylation domain-containing protein
VWKAKEAVKSRTNNRGFTLIEVMISMMVLVVLAMIYTACMPAAKKAGQVNGQYSQAISLCQHKIDQLRAAGFGKINYTELSDGGIIDDAPTVSPFHFDEVDEVSTYLPPPITQARAIVTVTDSDPSDEQLQVTVTVTWKNATYQAKTSTMSLTATIAN